MIMENQNPFFSFPIVYGESAVICKVLMQESGYDVFFDDRPVASIEHTEEWTWIQASGVILPQTIIDEIGFEIEKKYS